MKSIGYNIPLSHKDDYVKLPIFYTGLDAGLASFSNYHYQLASYQLGLYDCIINTNRQPTSPKKGVELHNTWLDALPVYRSMARHCIA